MEYVRKDIVNQAFLNLPERESTNILLMHNSMNQAKVIYSLNDYELAFLVYYWIAQSITLECQNNDYKYENPVTTFKFFSFAKEP